MKNVILAIDGGTFNHIQKYIDKEYLPNFKKIVNQGFSSKLNVTIPPTTIPSFPCLFSGLTPGQLGFYYFNHPKKGLFNSNYWKNESIFSIPTIKSFVLNVPGTFPAWKINGEMITGMLSPSLSCYPAELKFFLNKNWIINGKTIQEMFKAFKIKSRLFLRKIKTEDFNLFTYVIRLPDALSHKVTFDFKLNIYSYERYLRFAYKKIDNLIGKILDSNIDNIILLSDHGLKNYKHGFHIRRWLEKQGLIFQNGSNKKKFHNFLLKYYYFIKQYTKIDSNFFGIRTLSSIYKKYMGIKRNKVNTEIKNKSNKIILNNFFSNYGGLTLPKHNKILLKEILEKLSIDKSIEEVSAPKKKYYPDLIITLKNKYFFDRSESFFIRRKSRSIIEHDYKGVFFAYGKNIKTGTLHSINYLDIAPTILKIFDIPQPQYMKGKALDIISK